MLCCCAATGSARKTSLRAERFFVSCLIGFVKRFISTMFSNAMGNRQRANELHFPIPPLIEEILQFSDVG
jgi:hypothetical protein